MSVHSVDLTWVRCVWRGRKMLKRAEPSMKRREREVSAKRFFLRSFDHSGPTSSMEVSGMSSRCLPERRSPSTIRTTYCWETLTSSSTGTLLFCSSTCVSFARNSLSLLRAELSAYTEDDVFCRRIHCFACARQKSSRKEDYYLLGKQANCYSCVSGREEKEEGAEGASMNDAPL